MFAHTIRNTHRFLCRREDCSFHQMIIRCPFYSNKMTVSRRMERARKRCAIKYLNLSRFIVLHELRWKSFAFFNVRISTIRECFDGASDTTKYNKRNCLHRQNGQSKSIRSLVSLIEWCSTNGNLSFLNYLRHESVYDDNNRLWMVNNNEVNCEKETHINGVRSAFNARTDKSRRTQ